MTIEKLSTTKLTILEEKLLFYLQTNDDIDYKLLRESLKTPNINITRALNKLVKKEAIEVASSKGTLTETGNLMISYIQFRDSIIQDFATKTNPNSSNDSFLESLRLSVTFPALIEMQNSLNSFYSPSSKKIASKSKSKISKRTNS